MRRGARHRRLCRDGNASRTLLAPPTGPGTAPDRRPEHVRGRALARAPDDPAQAARAVDPLPEREWESFVITEDDYIDYLGRSELTAVVPVSLAAKLRRSHFLFLGYDMADWNLRLILNRIWGERPVAYRSWAVERSPSPLAQAFWRRYDVTPLDVEPAAYVELLARRMENAA